MSEEKKSPLEFNHIPHRNGLFVHFDANTQTYLVQAFFKADDLQELMAMIPFRSRAQPLTLDVPAASFDDARDAFIKKLIDADAPKEASHAR